MESGRRGSGGRISDLNFLPTTPACAAAPRNERPGSETRIFRCGSTAGLHSGYHAHTGT